MPGIENKMNSNNSNASSNKESTTEALKEYSVDSAITPLQQSPINGGGNVMELIEWWKERLGALTELQLPTDYPRPLPLQIVEAEKTLQLSDQNCLQLLQLGLQLSTLSSVLSPSTSTHPFTGGLSVSNRLIEI
jgi:hypothetical protein